MQILFFLFPSLSFPRENAERRKLLFSPSPFQRKERRPLLSSLFSLLILSPHPHNLAQHPHTLQIPRKKEKKKALKMLLSKALDLVHFYWFFVTASEKFIFCNKTKNILQNQKERELLPILYSRLCCY